MKRFFAFLKTTLIGGLVVVVPVVLVVMALWEAVDLVGEIIAPLEASLPVTTIAGIDVTALLALLIVLGLCFAAGVAARTGPGTAVGRWLEKHLEQLPGYKMVRTFARSLTRADARRVQPALLTNPMDTRVLAFVIEESDTHCVVMVPNAPAVMTGSLQYVAKDRVTRLNISLADASKVLSEYGVGALSIFEDGTTRSDEQSAAR